MSTRRQGSADRDDAMVRSGRRAMTRWVGFPVHADPRPLVLLSGPVRVDAGFATGDAKIAFLQGAVEAADMVAEEAVRPLRTPAVRMGRQPRVPLRVTAAVRSETEFATDRGPRLRAAWRVVAIDTLGPIWVLSREVLSHCWSPPEMPGEGPAGPHMLSTGRVGPDRCQLVVGFVGGSDDLYRYDAEVVESATAVCVVSLGRLTGEFPAGTMIPAIGHPRQIVVTLAEPLGGRVLVNLDGSPVSVTTDTRPTTTAPTS